MWVNSKVIQEAVEKIVRQALNDATSTVDQIGSVIKLREQIEQLKIEKARREEDFARREREVEHKVGLERKRQEFEIAQSKREATVTVREENLKADRERFEQQLTFQNDRFTTEVGYLKDMISGMLKRLPSAEVIATLGNKGA